MGRPKGSKNKPKLSVDAEPKEPTPHGMTSQAVIEVCPNCAYAYADGGYCPECGWTQHHPNCPHCTR